MDLYANATVAASILAFVVMLGLLSLKRLRRDRAERLQAHRLHVLTSLVEDPDVVHGAVSALRSLTHVRPAELARMERVLRRLDAEQLAAVRDAARATVGSRLLARLIRETRHPQPPRRAIAALLLGRLALPGSALIVPPLLADHDPDVAQAACRALGVLGEAEGARALVTALGQGHVPVERIVENLVAPAFCPVLVGALGDPACHDVAQHIVRAIGLIGDHAAEEALLASAATADDELQVAICRALGTVGTDRSAGHLVAMLRHDSWPVRAQAATSLASLSPAPKVVAALELSLGDPAWWVRANAAGALRRLGGAGIAGLIRATRHPDRYARARAEEALALIAIKGATV